MGTTNSTTNITGYSAKNFLSHLLRIFYIREIPQNGFPAQDLPIRKPNIIMAWTASHM